MEMQASNEQPAEAPPQLRPAQFGDYAGIMRLMGAHSFPIASFDDWAYLWQANPLWKRLDRDWPIGWVLERATGEIVGTISNVPSLYVLGGRTVVCASPRAWVVADAYRGYGLWLPEECFNQPGVDLYITTSAGLSAQAAMAEFATRIPLGEWNTISYWITGHRMLAEQALERRRIPFARALSIVGATALQLRDILRGKRPLKRNGSVAVELADGFDSRFDAFWRELRQQNPEKLLAERSCQALAWHFWLPLRERRLWILTASRNGHVLAYCILKQHPRTTLRVLRLVDYQSIDPDVDVLPDLLIATLQMCRSNGIDLLENPGYGIPKMHAFDRRAPYHRKLEYWPFFYHAAEPQLAEQLQRPSCWDPSTFDGDASLE
jgi:hypothetical protein